jgi:CheY-like chemotaxis protein
MAPARARVLVVDDEPELREMITMLLEPTYEVTTAVNGADALRSMSSEPSDVVLLDLAMPVLDGEAYLHTHRKRFPEIPVVLASSEPELHRKAQRLGACGWLHKPFSFAALVRALDFALAPSRA